MVIRPINPNNPEREKDRQMSKKHFFVFAALTLLTTLLPSEVWAAGNNIPGGGLFEQTFRTLGSLIKRLFMPVLKGGAIPAIGFFLGCGMGVLGLLKTSQGLRSVIGKPAGLVKALLKLASLPLMFLFLRMVFKFLVRLIPFVGGLIPDELLNFVAGLIIVFYLAMRLKGMIENGFSAEKKEAESTIASTWANPSAGDGVLVAFFISIPLNFHWNEETLMLHLAINLGSIAFGLVGLYRSSTGFKAYVDKGVARVGPARQHRDGSWDCPNYSIKIVRGKDGRKVKKKVYCERRHKPNAANAKFCGSKTCDYPNPYLPVPCGGTNKDGSPCENKEVEYGTSCTECGTWKEELPETMPWTTPETDKFNEGTHGVDAAAQEVKQTPKGSSQAPKELETTSCPNCHQVVKMLTFCTHCGHDLSTGEAKKPKIHLAKSSSWDSSLYL